MIVVRESCIPPKASHHTKRIVKRGGFARMADKAELVAAKSFWDALFLQAPDRPRAPLDGPLVCEIELRWPHDSNVAKKRAHLDLPMDVKPDCENIAKTVIDSLVRCGYMVNDSRIVDLRVRKWKSPTPGIVVSLGRAS